MAIVGYTRVSTEDQNLDRQLAGLQVDKLFAEKVSGKSTDRPQLRACLDYLREGDTLIVHSMDRLARNLQDLLATVKGLVAKGITVRFTKENLEFGNVANPWNDLLLGILGSIAQFERAIILERQREGIAVARTKGVYKGRKPSLSLEQAIEAHGRIESGESVASVARGLGCSRSTLYKWIKEAGLE